MSLNFKSKYDQLREGNPTARELASEQIPEVQNDSYYAQSNTRNVGFSWPDGRRIFLNYSYLISGDYLPEENSLILTWTTHTVKIKGYRLDLLFDELMQHLPRQIVCTDPRYSVVSEKGKVMVNEIHITSNG